MESLNKKGDLLPTAPQALGTSETRLQPVFVAGCERSGTTLLGSMLGSHPLCLTAPEAKFNLTTYKSILRRYGRLDIPKALQMILADWSFQIWRIALQSSEIVELEASETYPQLIKKLVAIYGEAVGKVNATLWIDHTPHSILGAPLLFDLYPEARMLHLVRDGRATAASVMKLDWGPNTIVTAAPWWAHRVAHGLAAESQYGPERIRRVRYEDLLADPQSTLHEICDFLAIDFVPQMLHDSGFRVPTYTARQHALVGGGLQSSRAIAWQKELTARQIEIFESVAQNLLSCFGYELMFGPGARPAMAWEKIQSLFQEIYLAKFFNRFRKAKHIRWALSQPMQVRAELSRGKSVP